MEIKPKLDLVILDCPDAMELATFYSELLGWPVLALGAHLHEHQPSQDGGFRVYRDPVGHPFCLIS
jgi:hypothetical protein